VEQYLRIGEAAKFLRAHPASVSRWVREGRLPAYKSGNFYVFTEQELRDFVKPVAPSRPKSAVS
jgi:excisionase family DNA binding protein